MVHMHGGDQESINDQNSRMNKHSRKIPLRLTGIYRNLGKELFVIIFATSGVRGIYPVIPERPTTLPKVEGLQSRPSPPKQDLPSALVSFLP